MQVSDKVNRNAAATYGIMCSLNIKARKHILAPLAIMKQRLYMNIIGALGEASLLSKKLRIAKMVRNIRGGSFQKFLHTSNREQLNQGCEKHRNVSA